MPHLPEVRCNQAVRVLRKVGFEIAREGKHTIMSDGKRILTISRHSPINAFTMGGIAKHSGLTPEKFRKLL